MIEQEIINHLPDFLTILPFLLAFSINVRKSIGKRDHWTCQDCGVQFKDGYMVHASHYNHDKTKPNYDDINNGRIQCVDCHEAWHVSHMGDEGEIGMNRTGNLAAIELLEATDRGVRK